MVCIRKIGIVYLAKIPTMYSKQDTNFILLIIKRIPEHPSIPIPNSVTREYFVVAKLIITKAKKAANPIPHHHNEAHLLGTFQTLIHMPIINHIIWWLVCVMA